MNARRRLQLYCAFGILAMLITACGTAAAPPPSPASEQGLIQSTGTGVPQTATGVPPTPIVALGTPEATVAEEEEVVPSGGAEHVIEVSLQSGEKITIQSPEADIVLHCRFFDLHSDLDLIQSITQQADGYLVAFNSGETLLVDSVEGQLEFAGEFGQAQVSLDGTTGFQTLTNDSKRDTNGTFSKEHYRQVDLRFQDGLEQSVFVSEYELQFEADYRGLDARVFLGRAAIEYDWQAMTVRIGHPDLGSIELSRAAAPTEPRLRSINANYGWLYFDFEGLAGSRPLDPAVSYSAPYELSFTDGTRLPVDLLYPTCPEGIYECVKVGGEEPPAFNLDQVRSITPGVTAGSGTIEFIIGGKRSFEAAGIAVAWALGEIELPLSAAIFSELVRNEGDIVPSAGPFQFLIRLLDGQEMQADLDNLDFATSTAIGDETVDGVLQMIGFPMPMGAWLVDVRYLAADNVDGQLQVPVFGQPYPAGPAADRTLTLRNAYGQIALAMDEISSIRPVSWAGPPPETLSVRLTTRDGDEYSFPSEKVEFVRYPNEIGSGTRYTHPLGAWYWHRYDTIQVRTDAQTVDAELANIRRLRLSGDYPEWDIELVGSQTGQTLNGKVVPAEVATEGTGIWTWKPEDEGFWFSWQSGHAFLFVPASAVATIEITP